MKRTAFKRAALKRGAQRGASMVIALILFLLCTVAGVTALTMAATNAGRYSHAQEDRQAYYSVSSAALLMADMLDGLEYRSADVEYDYVSTRTYDAATNSRGQTDTYSLNLLRPDGAGGFDLIPEKERAGTATLPAAEDETEGETAEREGLQASKLVAGIRAQCDAVVPYLSVPQAWYRAADPSDKTHAADFMPAERRYAFTVSSAEGGIGKVNGTLIMGANYDLIMTFSFAAEGGAAYAVSAYWKADVREIDEESTPVFSYTDGGDVSVTTRQKRTVCVTWDKKNVTVSRGEVA